MFESIKISEQIYKALVGFFSKEKTGEDSKRYVHISNNIG